MPRRNKETETEEPKKIQLPTTLEAMLDIEATSKEMIAELRNLEELVRVRSSAMTEVLRAFQAKIIPVTSQILEMREQYNRAIEQAVLLAKEEKPTLEEFIAERAEEAEQSDILFRRKEPRKALSDGDEGDL